jgi:hypothetical protein
LWIRSEAYPVFFIKIIPLKGEGIRRITATPLYFKAENWRLDMPNLLRHPI